MILGFNSYLQDLAERFGLPDTVTRWDLDVDIKHHKVKLTYNLRSIEGYRQVVAKRLLIDGELVRPDHEYIVALEKWLGIKNTVHRWVMAVDEEDVLQFRAIREEHVALGETEPPVVPDTLVLEEKK